MEGLEVVLCLGNRVASFFVEAEKVDIPMEPDYV